MLKLSNICKDYQAGDNITHALDHVSVNFRPQEFVAILGPSGSGKTTLLNVIGGLGRYDSGDLIINGQSTKNFKDTEWDAYRNNSVGFIFQNYNLISHLSIMENVELGMTLSGIGRQERAEKAKQALIKVGLGEQIGKHPNELSGGQMQRVAIARAIAGDPDILLCDEPTGALDSKTSQQIMDLIKSLSQERLVIMVTHNQELAADYADRILQFKDGEIKHDSNPYDGEETAGSFRLKRTKMSFANALLLSFTNILTKKGRTFLTAFAASIGIISIAVVLSLSSGFQRQIDLTMGKTLAKYPITIAQTTTDMSSMQNQQESLSLAKNSGYLTVKKDPRTKAIKTNKLTPAFINYVKKINPQAANNIAFQRSTALNLLTKKNGHVQTVTFSNVSQQDQNSITSMQNQEASSLGVGSSVFPTSLRGQKHSAFLKQNYQLLAGSWPASPTDVVLVIDNKNSLAPAALTNLGFKVKEGDKLNYQRFIGQTYRIVDNDHYYQQVAPGQFLPRKTSESMYQNASLHLRLCAVIRPKSRDSIAMLASGIAYSNELTQKVIKLNQKSQIVQAQKTSSTSVLTGQALNQTSKKLALAVLGGDSTPSSIMIYPTSFDHKDEVLRYLDKWNKGKSKADRITYVDMSNMVTQLTGGLLNGITIVLIGFAAISLITSMIMIGILTYTSVLERVKEIGVLKALGARKKDITRVFDAETCLLGIFSGILGVVIAYLLTFPINQALYNLTDLRNVAFLDPKAALILVIISTILTMLGGHLPARLAAKKEAAQALRSE
ncbi:MAG: ABC transporter ATP-binding protein/permease [Lactobacillus sp.]|jgi:putative ABC transport system permease protein|nr:ABC transporter ATP-binding protein/permease [Lactobacillus sp.]MCH4068487.1 ABC transporter ATP-binding protein/permease [Lactobacillus sp.]MCI1304236.1 ABC transporter ATP-binding protein/permease [Lactobacillus sp.]MCI1330463.1 ABC transporter ATP-binding protein/permease [Lactobacillus sp.]MCI1359257.1 ABC transporter ATP-binding protein/permease [Lactobacillus sp.]